MGIEKNKLSLLIVDDEPDFAKALSLMLRDFEVRIVSDAQAAAEAIKTAAYSAAIVDIHMPVLSGLDIYRLAEARGPEWARRVIFMTGGACSTATQKFLESISNTCLEKPFELAGLRRSVKAVSLLAA